jgi:hypothetical protein
MKKILILSALTSAVILNAGIDTTVLGKSRGGLKNESDAIKDGIGYIITKPTNGNAIIDNSAYNTALYEYADKVTYSNNTADGATEFKAFINSDVTIQAKLKDGVSTGTSTTVLDKLNTLKLKDPTYKPDGAACDDNNAATKGDVYLNGLCSGHLDGASCNDGNALTNGDQYLNAVCIGHVDGETCNDNNTNTYNDKYTNGVCDGLANGATCDDGNAITKGDKYVSGVCVGHADGEVCDDNNPTSLNDVYTNGICSGSMPCDDGTRYTNNDMKKNGVCAGVYIDCSTYNFGTSISFNLSCEMLDSNYTRQHMTNSSNFAGITSMKTLYLSGGTNMLTSLDGFSSLTTVNGTLWLDSNNTPDANGLRNLHTVSGDIFLFEYTNYGVLKDVSGLNGLTFVGGNVLLPNYTMTVKMDATSYLCQNYSTKIKATTSAGSMDYSAQKSWYCNP